MTFELEPREVSNIIHLLQEQNESYFRCIVNHVGERDVWEHLIALNEDLIRKLDAK